MYAYNYVPIGHKLINSISRSCLSVDDRDREKNQPESVLLLD